ncbi:pyruvate, water dikinase regulatory protein [Nocardioides dongkuii]|uniref:pyruvate, water dikinase regulatory protein n=1 Tax=Nocardioides dongkuii TaxID=2760089 RepID=UPI0015FCA3C3|nr:pyruvate, phosphate dikinase/phosphoenolpyruvate synthase regulator [Nocardioides dongkuii]
MDEQDDEDVVPVFFLSDSTGISAETMGNALLIQFPDTRFERTLIPFIHTVEDAREVVEQLDEAMDGPVTPLVFTTAADDRVRQELLKTRAPIIDFFEMHMSKVEAVLGRSGIRQAARLHGVGDIKRYNNRMAAVEFTIEHDDGQSLRALEKSDVILLAPSRCGKTPTSMYLALQHGLFVANYPLVDEDLEADSLPEPVAPYLARCFGLTTTVDRLSRVRNERRPGSRYASPEQCRWELRRAAELFAAHRVPVIDSSAKSVEEISALILQTLKHDARTRRRAHEGKPT